MREGEDKEREEVKYKDLFIYKDRQQIRKAPNVHASLSLSES